MMCEASIGKVIFAKGLLLVVIGRRRRSRGWQHNPGAAGQEQGDGSPATSIRTRRRPEFRKRSEEHTSELQSLMRISYAVFCLKKKKKNQHTTRKNITTKTK